MESKEIRKKFLEFFEKRGHKIVPSSSLIPDDPSVLLTTAGMQQFKPYFIGKADPIKDFGNKNVVSIQKCFRTSDIDEVGDESHLTFFEMLGNFSFGGYGKKEAIEYAYEFIVKEMGLKIDYVTVFGGDEQVPRDEESIKNWNILGFFEEKGNLRFGGRENNFWGPTGSEGPCGPTSEIYVNGLEIWNLVFNEYYCDKNKKLTKLENLGIDTGMGLERLAMVSQGVKTVFDTDLLEPLINSEPLKSFDITTKRILADHVRAIVYLIADGVEPSKRDRGYVVKRLLRKVAVSIGKEAVIPFNQREQLDWNERTFKVVIFLKNLLLKLDKNLFSKSETIDFVIRKETDKFIELLESGKKLEEVIEKYKNSEDKKIPAVIAFNLHQSSGIHIDFIREEVKKYNLEIDEVGLQEEFKKHQEISRAGSEKKFGGHGFVLDTGEIKAGNDDEMNKVTRLHTATHLLQRALREVLGNEVEQRGSDITSERTRFDFSFARKLTQEEIKKAEDLVNQKIKEDLSVNFQELPIEEAKKTGALFFFREKYPETVKVYFIGDSLEKAWSKEFCGGPHVKRTSEIGNFKIIKEEAVAAGVRRIRAAVS